MEVGFETEKPLQDTMSFSFQCIGGAIERVLVFTFSGAIIRGRRHNVSRQELGT